MPIHPTALIDPRATIDPSADVGPYVVIDGPVRVGPRTRVLAHAVLVGATELGADNVVHFGAVLGDEPQDLAYRGEATGLRIGDGNVFRENCEIHRGTKADSWTTFGDDNYFMQSAHVAHNCRIGNRAIVGGGALLAGHVGGRRSGVRLGQLRRPPVRAHRPPRAPARSVAHQSRRAAVRHHGRNAHGARRQSRRAAPRGLRRGAHPRRGDRVPHPLPRTRPTCGPRSPTSRQEVRTPDVEELLAFIRASTRGVAMGPARGRTEAPEEE